MADGKARHVGAKAGKEIAREFESDAGHHVGCIQDQPGPSREIPHPAIVEYLLAVILGRHVGAGIIGESHWDQIGGIQQPPEKAVFQRFSQDLLLEMLTPLWIILEECVEGGGERSS